MVFRAQGSIFSSCRHWIKRVFWGTWPDAAHTSLSGAGTLSESAASTCCLTAFPAWCFGISVENLRGKGGSRNIRIIPTLSERKSERKKEGRKGKRDGVRGRFWYWVSVVLLGRYYFRKFKIVNIFLSLSHFTVIKTNCKRRCTADKLQKPIHDADPPQTETFSLKAWKGLYAHSDRLFIVFRACIHSLFILYFLAHLNVRRE